jgi:pilus assembly protein CpaB
MQKQRIILIVGIVLAVLVVFLIKYYLDQQQKIFKEEASREAAKSQENQTSVLVAKQEILKGTNIIPELFEAKIVPQEYVVPQAVTSLDRISGMIAIAPIAKGEQISTTKLTNPRQAGSGGGLAEATPVGKRAITINVDNIASVAGMIRPGDYVDIIATIPVPSVTADGKQAVQAAVVPLFQNVLVLAVGQRISTVSAPIEAGGGGRYDKESQQQQPPQQPASSPLITLALSPQEANLIAFVQEQGKLRLILRSPADSQMQQLKPISWDVLFQYLMPKEISAAKQAKEEVEAAPTAYVEIYRGLKREKVPLK